MEKQKPRVILKENPILHCSDLTLFTLERIANTCRKLAGVINDHPERVNRYPETIEVNNAPDYNQREYFLYFDRKSPQKSFTQREADRL